MYSDRLESRGSLAWRLRADGGELAPAMAVSCLALAILELADVLDDRLGELGEALRGGER
jgi:hypothetical protein